MTESTQATLERPRAEPERPEAAFGDLDLSRRAARVLQRLGYSDRSAFLAAIWGPLEADGLSSRLARAHGVGPALAGEIKAAWERGRRTGRPV